MLRADDPVVEVTEPDEGQIFMIGTDTNVLLALNGKENTTYCVQLVRTNGEPAGTVQYNNITTQENLGTLQYAISSLGDGDYTLIIREGENVQSGSSVASRSFTIAEEE